MKNDTFYFTHDFNARNDRKLVKVKLKYRMAGIGIFWSIVEMLFEENGKLLLSDIPTISADFREKEVLVSSIINDFELFENDGKFFWSNSVNRRIKKRLEKSEKAKESASYRWQNANGMRTHSDGNAIKERKGNKRKEKKIGKGADAPAPKSFKVWTNEEFVKDIQLFKDQFHKDFLNAFYKYWSEKSPSGKMKFQLEDTWETTKRLDTWKRNEEKFGNKNGNHTNEPDQSQMYRLKNIS